MQPLSPRSASLEPPLRGALLVTLTVISVLLTGLASAQQVTVAAVGDIACSPDGNPNASGGKGDETRCQMLATSELVAEHGVQAVLALGDLQYASSSRQLAAFRASYDLSWGRFKDITYPVPGNHEYDTPDAEGYYKYFGDRAGDPERGYDSFDLGEWHIVALNSNCEEVGGCGAGSEQSRWLESDVEAHPSACLLAFWHHPRFSSGKHGSRTVYQEFWNILQRAGADVVLAGHDHDYERFAPLSANGDVDVERGVRAFVVGTGGVSLRPAGDRQAHSEVFIERFGVLFLNLGHDKYEWSFVAPGGDILDRGKGRCGSVPDGP